MDIPLPTPLNDAQMAALKALSAASDLKNNFEKKQTTLASNTNITNSSLSAQAEADNNNLKKGSNSSNKDSSIINDKFVTDLLLKRKEFDNVKTQKHDNENDTNDIFKKLLQDVSLNYGTKSFAPHINGYHHVSIQAGDWVSNANNTYAEITALNDVYTYTINNGDKHSYKNMSADNNNEITEFQKMNGTYITDIDIPQLSLEYESVSGKQRSLNYATRINYASDFSITYINDFNNNVMKFHDAHFKYIDLYRKGYVKNTSAQFHPYFIDVPYFNAVWVAIFKPFTLKIACLIKIMGVAPINLPFKQLLGDRSKPAITTLNINYKSTDIFWKFYSDNVNASSDKEPFLQEYLNHIKQTITGYIKEV